MTFFFVHLVWGVIHGENGGKVEPTHWKINKPDHMGLSALMEIGVITLT